MPATSKSQQQFMGLVRAVQKGDVPASKVTSNVRQAAKDMSAEDVKDFASTKTKNLPDKVSDSDSEKKDSEEKKKETDSKKTDEAIMTPQPSQQPPVPFAEVVGRYNEYGQLLRRDRTLSELAQQLSDIAEYAEYALTNEGGMSNDWYDKHTITRNIKEMKAYANEFAKIAQEADQHQIRMTALYDDMGRVLERYFNIYDNHAQPSEDMGDYREPRGPNQKFKTVEPPKDDREYVGAQPRQSRPGMRSELTHQPDHSVETLATQDPDKKGVFEDELHEKAIALVRERLVGENLVKFDSMPKEKQVRVAWRALK